MLSAQNVLLVLGGWFVASIGAAAIWARIAVARRAPDESAGRVYVSGEPVSGSDADAVVAGALDGSPWLGLGPLQDRVAGRRAQARERTGTEADAPVVG